MLLDAGANVQVMWLAKHCCVSHELAVEMWSGACVLSRSWVAGVLSFQVLMSGHHMSTVTALCALQSVKCL